MTNGLILVNAIKTKIQLTNKSGKIAQIAASNVRVNGP